MRRRYGLAGLALALLAVIGGGTAAAQSGPVGHHGYHVRVVVSGLNNPRDLAFGTGGRLYLAEAGRGGRHCVGGGEQGETCVGRTGSIDIVRVHRHSVRRVVTGLISLSGSDGSFALGVDGISVLGRNRIYGIIGESRDIVPPPGVFPAGLTAAARAQLGRLILANRDGNWRAVGDVGHRDYRWTGNHKNLVPDQYPDANPYGVFASRDTQWVVDAGANTIDSVHNGKVHVLKFIPNPPSSDAVPTCIDRGPDGAFYIGQLTGGGNAPGSANVYRFAPWEKHPLTVWARGLTAITGCGFDSHGHFIAVEFSTNGLDNAAPGTGEVVRVPRHSSHPVVLVSGLDFPGGFAAGANGSLYVSNWSIAPASGKSFPPGQVVRISR
jgi:hypothetical protein